MIIPDWLRRQAAVRPDHPAVETESETVSFRALERRVGLLTRRLRATGVERGACVAALLRNGLPLVELVHAVPRLGAALVLLDPRLSAPEAAERAAHARARLVIAEDDTAAAAGAAAAASGAALSVVAPGESPCSEVTSSSGGEPDPLVDLDVPHTILFTSGTSGEPKAVVLTAGNHLWSALGSAARLGVHRDDRWLACLPLTHVGGLSIVLRSVLAGTTVVLHRRFDPDAVARALAIDRVSVVSLVPTTLGRLLPSFGVAPALRCVLLGGAAPTPDLLAAARARGLPLAITYGLTEAASQVATAPPGGTAPLPLLHTSVRIVRADGSAALPEERGGIEVRGPTVTPGYLARDGTLRDPTVDGWLPTGDRGTLDERGALTVSGRRDDVIVTGGENVDPAEVEAVLATHPEVAEVAVAGVPDPEWGQAVAAWIVPRSSVRPTLDELRATCRARLAPHKLPRRLTWVDALPRTATGKVRRATLAATLT